MEQYNSTSFRIYYSRHNSLSRGEFIMLLTIFAVAAIRVAGKFVWAPIHGLTYSASHMILLGLMITSVVISIKTSMKFYRNYITTFTAVILPVEIYWIALYGRYTSVYFYVVLAIAVILVSVYTIVNWGTKKRVSVRGVLAILTLVFLLVFIPCLLLKTFHVKVFGFDTNRLRFDVVLDSEDYVYNDEFYDLDRKSLIEAQIDIQNYVDHEVIRANVNHELFVFVFPLLEDTDAIYVDDIHTIVLNSKLLSYWSEEEALGFTSELIRSVYLTEQLPEVYAYSPFYLNIYEGKNEAERFARGEVNYHLNIRGDDNYDY